VVGTLHLLDALRDGSIAVTLVVTSDKVYANDDAGVPFTELAPLGGDDPYSASKAATEIAVNSWRKSFPEAAGCLISARAGNVLGGGDFAEHRLIPDIMRAVLSGQPLMLRAPRAVRPWQHVLDVLGGYLTYIERAHDNSAVPPALNFGPSSNVRVSAGTLVDMMIDRLGLDVAVEIDSSHNAPEKHVLSLDASEASRILGWVPRLNLQETVDWTAAWYRAWIEKSDIRSITDRQIADFEARSLS
jgi:CDP-glucose 4,6-dehydratase